MSNQFISPAVKATFLYFEIDRGGLDIINEGVLSQADQFEKFVTEESQLLYEDLFDEDYVGSGHKPLMKPLKDGAVFASATKYSECHYIMFPAGHSFFGMDTEKLSDMGYEALESYLKEALQS